MKNCTRNWDYNLDYYLDLRILGHAGHVQRMGAERLPKLLRDSYLDRKQKRGRPTKSHGDQILQCMDRKGIDASTWKSTAENRAEWHNSIRAPSVYTGNRKYQGDWENEPKILLGEKVEKKFGGKWHEGEITNHDVDVDTNQNIWRVIYDDGDEADYDATQMKRILCDA